MSDALNCVEIDEQNVELLPARTVLSMISLQDPAGGNAGNGGQGGTGGTGGANEGKAFYLYPAFSNEGNVTSLLTGGLGGDTTANGGAATGGTAIAALPPPAS
jgi:hypothetical protein